MSYRLSGLNPLAYMGVEPYTPPILIVRPQTPTPNDINFNLGSFWLNSITYQLYSLANVAQGVAAWEPLGYMQVLARAPLSTDYNYPIGTFWLNTSSDILYLLVSVSGESATWVTVSTEVNENTITGDSGGAVSFSDTGNIDLTGDTSGLTVVGTPLTNTLSVEWATPGTTGQVLAGVTGVAPKFLTLESTNSSIAITQGASTLNFEVGSGIIETVTGDSGGAVSPATGGNITIVNATDSGLELVGNPSTHTLTLQYATAGTNGQVLIGSTSAAPVWGNITSTDGTITITNGANTIDLSAAPSSSFVAYLATTYTITPGSGVYKAVLGTGGALTALTNVGSNFYVGSGSGSPALYTAPVTGVYSFTVGTSVAVPSTYPMAAQVTFSTGEVFSGGLTTNSTGGSLNLNQQITVVKKMTAGDTAQFSVSTVPGGPLGMTLTVYGYSTRSLYETYVSGYLVS